MKAAAALCLPVFWLIGWPVAVLGLATDCVATPWVLWRRRRANRGSMQPSDRRPTEPTASVIVLNHDGVDYLRALMPSLRVAVDRCPGDHEVIVVDNGSTDGSRELLAREFPWARVVALPENRFFIRGNRAGVEVAKRDVLVFLNNDMRVEPDFLRALLDRFGVPDLFALTARIEMAGERVETGRTRLLHKHGALRQEQVEHPPDGGPIPVVWAGGGSSAFDRDKYRALGGFEDLYEPCYVEDLSLSYQAWKRGWRVELVPDSVVHHAHRGTSERVLGAGRIAAIDRRNRELFFWRSVTDPRLWLRHALWLPWNAWKDARRGLGLGVQLRALLSALPRLPRALWARTRSREAARRTDAEVLRVANRVAPYRRNVVGRTHGRPIVLAIGTGVVDLAGDLDGLDVVQEIVAAEPAKTRPPEDVWRRVPREFWASCRDGPARERVRHLLFEVDHDAVLFADLHALALGAPFVDEPGRVVVLTDGTDVAMSPRATRFIASLIAPFRSGPRSSLRDTDSALRRALVGRH